ncbi:transposase [Bifidobacterium bifidum]|uniref:transposase n=1 Tax=Bifidobacterium bifidum TaxID=1681 RepID=UPI001EF9FEFA|nr:transposase [Bifidobacterium bifidum]
MAVDHKRRRVAWAHDGYGKEVLDLFFRQPADEQRASIKQSPATAPSGSTPA